MARWVTVATMRYINNVNDARKGRDRLLEIWERLIDQASVDKPDILLMPERFLGRAQTVEAVPGPGVVQDLLSRKARQYKMYIAAGMYRADGQGRQFNSGVLFDRAGTVAGYYDKMFPTPGEMAGKTPGDMPRVFDTDFGRIGMAICFDLSFPELFAWYAEQRVELCCFLSSMDGGAMFPALAREGRMYMASAVEYGTAYIVSPIGAVLAKTSQGVLAARINLDVQLFHLRPPLPEPLPVHLKRTYGPGVTIEQVESGAWSLLRCDRDDLTAKDIMREIGMETLDETLNRTRRMRRERVHSAFPLRLPPD